MIKQISKHLAFGTLIILLIIMATATVVEKLYGSELAHTQIYGAWWFVALWAILGICAVMYILCTLKPCTVHRIPCALLHCSFIMILLGAFITYLTGDRGQIHIRQGETANFYISEENAGRHSLPFDIKLILFDIEYHPGTDESADYISFLKINGEVCRISMNKIHKQQGYRLYQLDYDRDEMGTVLLVSHDPYGIAVTYSGYALLALSMLALLLMRIGWKKTLYIFIPVAGLWYYISQLNPVTPVLRSPMLAAHVSVILVSYLLLIIIMIFSIIGLCSKKRSRKHHQWSRLTLYPALFLLAAGIFIGAVWANISWGRYWGWDAKETWALITLLIYSLPLHKTSLPFFRQARNYHRYCLIAFLTLIMTFFGVSYLLGGIHSYV